MWKTFKELFKKVTPKCYKIDKECNAEDSKILWSMLNIKSLNEIVFRLPQIQIF